MFKKSFVILLFLFFFIIFLSSEEINFLKDPEGKDISNNNSVLKNNLKSFEFKFVSSEDKAYSVFWGRGEDTVVILPDSLKIFRVLVNPSKLEPGWYHIEILNKSKEKKLDFNFKVENSFSIFETVLKLLFGLVLFMLGLKFSSKGISRISGYRLKELLWNLSGSNVKGFLSGIILTLMMQSSTLFSIMVLSFVSDSLISISGAIYMFAGSAIGTSIIVQIISFNISFFSFLMIIIGFYLNDKSRRLKYVGLVIMGFGFIFFAIQYMASSMDPIKNSQIFINFLYLLENNLWILFVIFALLTFSVHSSAVTVAFAISLFTTGIVSFRTAVVMVSAANLGTSLTPFFAALKSGNKAKYLNNINILSKILTSIVFIILMFELENLTGFRLKNGRDIANLHLYYNILFSFVIIFILPLINYFSKFLKFEKLTKHQEKIIKENIIQNPTLALGKAQRDIIKMFEVVGKMLENSIEILRTNDTKLLSETIELDNIVDNYEKEISLFLVSIYEEELSEPISRKTKDLLFIVDELEHIGDIISKNLMLSLKKKINENYYFSDQGIDEIKELYREVLKTYSLTLESFTLFDKNIALMVLKRRENVLNKLTELQNKHLNRLREGHKESIETSTLHLDILNDYERINFHLYKIATNILKG
ncbi:MAG: Na/Pi cotransporter family protein [bacterium]|nr:Na/Pi cotransporter family protein [bacterium]